MVLKIVQVRVVRRDKLAAHSRLLRKLTYNVILGLILKRSYEEFKKEFLLCFKNKFGIHESSLIWGLF